MKKRRIIIIFLIILMIGSIFYIKRRIDFDKKVTIVTEYLIEDLNSAFSSQQYRTGFVPYSMVDESDLQLRLYAYEEATTKKISLEDIKKFLDSKKLSSGEIEIDDKNIESYVNWFSRNPSCGIKYSYNLQDELYKYYTDHPEYKKTINSVNLDEMEELEKKYKNPEYVLDLSKYGNE